MSKNGLSQISSKRPWEILYSQALPSTRTGLFYNTFSYPTKISPESIALYIVAHTNPGDTVLDVFAGSGSTGVAALMCEYPTESMKAMAKKYNLQPEWGARNAIVYEVGKYGAFASQVMSNPPDPALFAKAVKELLAQAEDELPDMYNTIDDEGNPGVIRHIIYSDVLFCPMCGIEFTYYEGMVSYDPLRINAEGVCPHCSYEGATSEFSYVTENVYDSLINKLITRRRRVPVKVYGRTGTKNWVREANDADMEDFHNKEALDYPEYSKAKEIVWGDLYRSGYHTGITHLHHFYTKRNFLVMSALWERTTDFEPKMRDALRLLLLSYNSAHATLMSRVVVKKNSKDFVLTGAQSGVLYVSSLPVEKNIFNGVKRKLKPFRDLFNYLRCCSGQIEVKNQNSQRLSQPDKSIDYVFTDPPFGSFIPYAEVNQINELWLGEPTNRVDEIIISNSQKKDILCYQKMMTEVFTEIRRVLKDGAFATVVFHSSKAAIWKAFCMAYSDAGFSVDAAASLNKEQASFKQVVSTGSVQGDPVILLSPGNSASSGASSQEILDDVILNAAFATPLDERRTYTKYIEKCLESGVTVDFDAKEVYEYIARKTGAIK